MQLTERQRKTLRGYGHDLKPVVMIADKGLSDNVAGEIELALNAHELIKISVRAERSERDRLIDTICDRFEATLVQRTGNIALVFRRNLKKPKIVLGSR
ncbi:MAG: YhbY family RNA-binding protein [Pseudomonadota bacterium]